MLFVPTMTWVGERVISEAAVPSASSDGDPPPAADLQKRRLKRLAQKYLAPLYRGDRDMIRDHLNGAADVLIGRRTSLAENDSVLLQFWGAQKQGQCLRRDG